MISLANCDYSRSPHSMFQTSARSAYSRRPVCFRRIPTTRHRKRLPTNNPPNFGSAQRNRSVQGRRCTCFNREHRPRKEPAPQRSRESTSSLELFWSSQVQEGSVYFTIGRCEQDRRESKSADRRCRLTSFPNCIACQYGKQHRRPIPGTTPSSVVKDRAHALKTDTLLAGQCISVDHFICSTHGCLLTSAGKTNSTTCTPAAASLLITPLATFLSSIKSV